MSAPPSLGRGTRVGSVGAQVGAQHGAPASMRRALSIGARLAAAAWVVLPAAGTFRLAAATPVSLPLASVIGETVVPGMGAYPPGSQGVALSTATVLGQVFRAPFSLSPAIVSACRAQGCPGFERDWSNPTSGQVVEMAAVAFPDAALAAEAAATTRPKGFHSAGIAGIPGAVGRAQAVGPRTLAGVVFTSGPYFVVTTTWAAAPGPAVGNGGAPHRKLPSVLVSAVRNEHRYLTGVEKQAERAAARAATRSRSTSGTPSAALIAGGAAAALVILLLGVLVLRRIGRRPRHATPVVVAGMSLPAGDAGAPSGWYADPTPGSGGQLRWWDGSDWGLDVLSASPQEAQGPQE